MPPDRAAPGRVVPTLTEVVEAGSEVLDRAAPASSEELVQSVLAELRRHSDAQLRALLRRQLEEALPLMMRRLLPEIEVLVRERVAEELARRGTDRP